MAHSVDPASVLCIYCCCNDTNTPSLGINEVHFIYASVSGASVLVFICESATTSIVLVVFSPESHSLVRGQRVETCLVTENQKCSGVAEFPRLLEECKGFQRHPVAHRSHTPEQGRVTPFILGQDTSRTHSAHRQLLNPRLDRGRELRPGRYAIIAAFTSVNQSRGT